MADSIIVRYKGGLYKIVATIKFAKTSFQAINLKEMRLFLSKFDFNLDQKKFSKAKKIVLNRLELVLDNAFFFRILNKEKGKIENRVVFFLIPLRDIVKRGITTVIKVEDGKKDKGGDEKPPERKDIKRVKRVKKEVNKNIKIKNKVIFCSENAKSPWDQIQEMENKRVGKKKKEDPKVVEEKKEEEPKAEEKKGKKIKIVNKIVFPFFSKSRISSQEKEPKEKAEKEDKEHWKKIQQILMSVFFSLMLIGALFASVNSADRGKDVVFLNKDNGLYSEVFLGKGQSTKVVQVPENYKFIIKANKKYRFIDEEKNNGYFCDPHTNFSVGKVSCFRIENDGPGPAIVKIFMEPI